MQNSYCDHRNFDSVNQASEHAIKVSSYSIIICVSLIATAELQIKSFLYQHILPIV
jgi:hypothetical protein